MQGPGVGFRVWAINYGKVTRWGTPMYWGTLMFGNVTALEGLPAPLLSRNNLCSAQDSGFRVLGLGSGFRIWALNPPSQENLV